MGARVVMVVGALRSPKLQTQVHGQTKRSSAENCTKDCRSQVVMVVLKVMVVVGARVVGGSATQVGMFLPRLQLNKWSRCRQNHMPDQLTTFEGGPCMLGNGSESGGGGNGHDGDNGCSIKCSPL